jgi:hypothetical protein
MYVSRNGGPLLQGIRRSWPRTGGIVTVTQYSQLKELTLHKSDRWNFYCAQK